LVAQLLNGLGYGMLLFLTAPGLSLIFGLINVVSPRTRLVLDPASRPEPAHRARGHDRHHVMNKGEICFTGTSAELERNEFVLRNYLSA
jgi:hypothetical protein